MKQLLGNKTFVIIGGTTGIGLSAAESFITEGAKIVIVGRNSNNVDQAISKLGQSAVGLAGDATQAQTAVMAIDLAIKKFGDFNGLYHLSLIHI